MIHTDQVNQYINQLGEAKWELRQIAMVELVAMGTSIASKLIETIESKEPSDSHGYNIRTHCIDILGKLQVTQAVDILIRETTNQNSLIRESAVIALANIGDERAIPVLLSMLINDPFPDVRENTAGALSRFRQPTVILALMKALQDDDDIVREAASNTLISFGDEVKSHVLKGLKHPNTNVQTECRYILHVLNDETYHDKYNERLWADLKNEDPWLRFLTISSLWQSTHPKDIPALELALQDKESDIRLIALRALQRIGTDEAYAVIMSAKSNKDARIRSVVEEIRRSL